MDHAIARFKELCLDTTRTDGGLGRFWAAATGCVFTQEWSADTGDVVPPEGGPEGMGIAICLVPEERTVKNRVHLDLAAQSVDELVALGATIAREVAEGRHRWTVLRDPEGNELCVFTRDEVPPYRVVELVVDAADPVFIGSWWAEVFGVGLEHGSDPWHWLEDVPGAPFRHWVFAPVPEPKTVKNRLHWDVYGDVAAFEERGARVLWTMARWTTMADPEGNEFCVFPDRSAVSP